MSKLRYPAVPLITVDPFFNIWSCCDHLYDDTTRHWTGRRMSFVGVINVDGTPLRFMGKVHADGRYPYEAEYLPQTDVVVRPMTTIYTFENEQIILTLEFMTPLLTDDLYLMTRPVSYVSYNIKAKDGKQHDIKLLFGTDSEICVDMPSETRSAGVYENGVFITSGEENMLKYRGDDTNIEWGTFHMFSEDGFVPGLESRDEVLISCSVRSRRNTRDAKAVTFGDEFDTADGSIYYATLRKEFVLDGEHSGYICMAYDDIHSINYFGKFVDAYYKKDGDTFENVCKKAVSEYAEIKERVKTAEDELIARALQVSEEYADIISLSYRQVIAAHKLTWDGEEIQFLSKECFSNGCVGTLDVTYPSIPMFLFYRPELVEGMMNPIFKFAASDAWGYDFAPHDVGRYPLATGQFYGEDGNGGLLLEKQMPVEECGNAIICVYTICHYGKNIEYFKKHKAVLGQWTKYLIEFGLDPGNQLCTDDFAGHLAHNCNLAVKAIVGIAAYAKLLEMTGDSEAEKYMEIAKKYAAEWEKNAFDGDHYRLAFDSEGTWSLKYNMVWDKMFGWNLFSEDVYKTEIEYYLKQLKPCGVPLDSRSDYTKSDWLVWTLRLTDDKTYGDKIIKSLWNMINTTPNRVPFTDWYFASTGKQRGFQNRTVQGGLFIPMI